MTAECSCSTDYKTQTTTHVCGAQDRITNPVLQTRIQRVATHLTSGSSNDASGYDSDGDVVMRVDNTNFLEWLN